MTNQPSSCPCGTTFPFAACCAPYLASLAPAPSAETLMRSRYTAYTRGHLDYLRKTWHVATCPQDLTVPAGTTWLGLQIKAVVAGSADEAFGTVEFVARSKLNGRASRLHETSRFERVNGLWVYKDGTLNSR